MSQDNELTELLRAGDDDLRRRLTNAHAVLDALQAGKVDVVFRPADGIPLVIATTPAANPYRSLLENIHQGVAMINRDGLVVFANRTFADWLGVPVTAIAGTPLDSLLSAEDWSALGKLLENNAIHQVLTLVVGQAPFRRHLQISLDLASRDSGADYYLIASDVSLLLEKQALMARQTDLEGQLAARNAELEAKNRTLEATLAELDDLYQNAPCGYHSIGPDGTFLRINRWEAELLGYAPEDMIGKMKLTDFMSPGSQKRFPIYFKEFMERGELRDVEFDLISREGRPVTALISATAVKDESGQFRMSRSTLYDVTEKNRLTRAMSMLSYVNECVMRAENKQELLQQICKQIVDVGGYRMAWIGEAVRDAGQSVKVLAIEGTARGYVNKKPISWGDNDYGRGPTGLAIRLGTTQVNQDFANNPNVAPWRDEALKDGLQSSIALPLADNEGVYGALTLYSEAPNAFAREEVTLLERLAGNLAYGLNTLKARGAREAAEAELKTLHQNLQRLVEERTAELTRATMQLQITQETMDHVGIGLYWIDAVTGRFVHVNQAAGRMIGYSQEEMLKLTVPDIDPNFSIDQFHAKNETAKQRTNLIFETEQKAKDGSAVPVEVNIRYIAGTDGQNDQIIGFARDITERKRLENELRKSEERIQQALYASNSFTFDWTLATDEVLRSSSCAAILKLPGDDALRDTSQNFFLHRVHPDDRERFVQMVRSLTPSDAAYSTNYRVKCGDGSVVELEEVGQGIFDAAGTLIRLVGLSTDVTLRKHLENELRKARDRAEELARLKSEFLANMSHEIRTPLNGVLGLAQIGYRDSVGRDKAQEAFKGILDSGKLLLTIINDILDFSKIEAGKLDIELAPFDPARLVDDTLRSVSLLAAGKALQLRAEKTNLPDACLGDPVRICQILLNLLSNAIKFTPAGEVRLSARHEDGELVFQVSDTGVGIAPEVIERLFQPFEQADSSITRKFGGTGLGLVISRRLAELMGGSLSVESTLGQGSTFTLRLPLQETEAVVAHDLASITPTPQRLKGLRLLVAEDNEVNQFVMEDLLCGEGAEVVLVGNGQQAVKAVASAATQFDAVLMDVQMPVMDGLEATRILGQTHPGLPVIGQTAHALKEEHDRCLNAGMVATINKPIDIEILVSTLLEQIEAR